MNKLLIFVIGLVFGIVLTAVTIVKVMPGMMLIQEESQYDFPTTIAKIEHNVTNAGWNIVSSKLMNTSMAKHGIDFKPRVQNIKICQEDYALKVLTSDRYVAALMPCTIAVYETDDGKIMISKMNTGLMGKMFGGVIAEVMGGYVAEDEHKMLNNIVKQ